MSYPGQRVQIDVRYVPKSCLVGAAAEEGGYYQYTSLDEYSHFRYLKAFQEHSTCSSTQFIRNCVRNSPLSLSVVRRATVLNLPAGSTPRLQKSWFSWESSISRFVLILQGTTASWSAATAKIMRNSMLLANSFLSRIFKDRIFQEKMILI